MKMPTLFSLNLQWYLWCDHVFSRWKAHFEVE